MDSHEFVTLCRVEKDRILRSYFDENDDSHVGSLIRNLNLDAPQQDQLKEIVSGVLSESIFTLLVALDGNGTLGGVQQRYVICDESGATFGGDGELSAMAYDTFFT